MSAEPTAARRRRSLRARLLGAAGVLIVLALGTLAALPWLVETRVGQSYLTHTASQMLGRPARFASVSVSTFPLPAIRIQKLEVGDEARSGSRPFLTVEDVRMRVKIRPLLTGRLELADVTLSGLELALIDEAGRWNVASLQAAASGRAPRGGSVGSGPSPGMSALGVAVFSRLAIADGTVFLGKRGAGSPRLAHVRLTLAPAGRPDVFTASGEAVVQPGDARVRLAEALLTFAVGRPVADAGVRASVDVEAADVSTLVTAATGAPLATGPASGTLRLRGTLGRLHAEGDVRAPRLLLPPVSSSCASRSRRPLALEDLRAPFTLSSGGFIASPAQARASGGAVSLAMELRLHPSPVLVVRNIRVTGVELEPLLGAYLCQPYGVSGPLELSGEIALAPGDPWRTLAGSGRFRVGRGHALGAGLVTAMNEAARAGQSFASLVLLPEGRHWTAEAPPDFESIAGSYTVVDGVVSTDDLVYQSRRMRAALAGTYRVADGRVDMGVTLTRGRDQARARVSGMPGKVVVTPSGVAAGDVDQIRRFAGGPAR